MTAPLRLLLLALGLGAAAPAAAQMPGYYPPAPYGPPPAAAWLPPVPPGTQYLYIPEFDGYYDLYAGQYLVFDQGRWLYAPYLPGYDPRLFHPVVVDYRGPGPWRFQNRWRARCPQYVAGYWRGGFRGYGRPGPGYGPYAYGRDPRWNGGPPGWSRGRDWRRGDDDRWDRDRWDDRRGWGQGRSERDDNRQGRRNNDRDED